MSPHDGSESTRGKVAVIGVVALFLMSTAVAGAIDFDADSQAPADVSSAQQSASSGYEGEINLTEADVKYAGEGVNDTAGWAIDSAGDVNGDGVDDLIIGAPRNDSAGPNTGAAYIVYGPADPGEVNLSDADVVLRGATNNELAGWSVSSAGDVNGDGLDDVVVGAPGNDTAAPNGGAAFVVYGDESLPAEMNLSAEDADAVLAGTEAYGQAGYSVSEVNRTGSFDGVAVGAPYANTTGTNAGAAYMVSGLTLGESPGSVLNLSNADAAYLGERDGSNAGWSVSTAGDVDADGTEDIAVGAPGYNVTAEESPTGEAQNRTGAAYVVDSSDWGTNSLSDASLTLIGESAGDRAGWSVSDAGDVNNDSTADLLVGAPFNDSHDRTDSGAAYLVAGSGSLGGEQSLADAEVRMAGAGALDRTGWSVSAAGSGDVTCDAVADVLVGAPYNDTVGENAGAAYLVSGETDLDGDLNLSDADATFRGENGTDRAGYAVSEAGDLNDDGSEDVAIGAPYNHSHDRTDAGAAYVLFSDCPEETAPETEAPTDTETETETPTKTPKEDTDTKTPTETETPTKTPKTDTDTPETEEPGVETETPEPDTDTDTPETDTDAPGTDTDTPETDTDTPETDTETPDTETPDTDTPDTETPTPTPTATPTPEPEVPDISITSECTDEGAVVTVTLENRDAVEYPVEVDLRVQGDSVGSVTFSEDGDTTLTTEIDLSTEELDDGRVINVFANDERLSDLQFEIQCDAPEEPEPEPEPEQPEISIDTVCTDDGAEATVTLENPDAVEYPVEVDLRVQGDSVGSVTIEEGETTATTEISLSTDALDEGRVINVFANDERLSDLQFEIQCDAPEDEPFEVTFVGCGNVVLGGPDDEFPMDVTLLVYSQGEDEVMEVEERLDEGERPGSPGGQLVGIETEFGTYNNPNFDYEERNCGNSEGQVPGEPGDPRDLLDDDDDGSAGNSAAGDASALDQMSQSPLFPLPFVGLMGLSLAVLATARTRES